MASLGSVQKTGIYSWKLTVSCGFDGGGKRIRHTKTVRVTSDNDGRQEKEARQQLALFISEIEKGQNATSGKMTLKQFFEYWLINYAEGRHAPKTIIYNKTLFKRIEAVMGHKRLDQIEPKHLLSFYKNLAEPGIRQDPNDGRRKIKPSVDGEPKENKPKKDTLSPNTIRKYHILLHSLFEKSTRWQLTAYNPAEKVEPPKGEKTVKKIYDEETTGRFLLLLEKQELKYRAMVMLSLAGGMRKGELFGLEWRHINFDAGTVRIEQASQYLPEKGIFTKDPKNENSNRIVTVPGSIITLLKKYKAEQSARRLKLGKKSDGGKWEGAEEVEDDRLFTAWNGLPAHPDSINTWLKKFIDENNLPPITPHSFRHMAATYLITSGTDLRTVAGKLGHSNSTTTQIVYSHLLKSAEQETSNKMESFLHQATEKAKEMQKKQAK